MYFQRTHRNAQRSFCLVAILTTVHCAHQVVTPTLPARPAQAARPASPPKAEPVQPLPAEEPPAIPLSILAGAFEPLHADDPTLPDEVLAAAHGRTLEGAYKICITPTGNVHSVVPVVSIAGADHAVISTLKSWQFQKLPTEVCKVQTFSFEVP